MKKDMTKDEMRFCRRELINFYLHKEYINKPYITINIIKMLVRLDESVRFGKTLKAYK